MSVINKMLKELEARRHNAGDRTRYQPPVPQLMWIWLLLVMVAMSGTLFFTWRTWQQWHEKSTHYEPVAFRSDPVFDRPASTGVAPTIAAEGDQGVAISASAATSTAVNRAKAPSAQVEESDLSAAVPAGESAEEYYARLDAALQPERQEEDALASSMLEGVAEEVSADSQPEPQLTIETVELSAHQRGDLTEQRANAALARGDTREAERLLAERLNEQPENTQIRKQLAAMFYGQSRMGEAYRLLEEGVSLQPSQPDFRLMLARLSLAKQQPVRAMEWLSGTEPMVAMNMDYYAMLAALAQELGQPIRARKVYLDLLQYRPSEGRWWMGLGVAEEALGKRQAARDAYQTAQLHGGLSEASNDWLTQRIAELADTAEAE